MTKPNALTLAAAAVVVYAISNVAHEGLGHAVACEALGGRMIGLNAAYCECDEAGMTEVACALSLRRGP